MWKDQVRTEWSSQTPNGRTTFLTSNRKEIKTSDERVVYIPPIQVEVVQGRNVVYPKSGTITELYNRKLMT